MFVHYFNKIKNDIINIKVIKQLCTYVLKKIIYFFGV